MRAYETPEIVDYGSLTEITTNNGAAEAEDGLGKMLHTDGSNPGLP